MALLHSIYSAVSWCLHCLPGWAVPDRALLALLPKLSIFDISSYLLISNHIYFWIWRNIYYLRIFRISHPYYSRTFKLIVYYGCTFHVLSFYPSRNIRQKCINCRECSRDWQILGGTRILTSGCVLQKRIEMLIAGNLPEMQVLSRWASVLSCVYF